MDSKAVRPTFYKSFTQEVNEVVGDKDLDKDQEALSYITHFRGWTLMKEYQERLNNFLDDSVKQAIANGASMKEIGERAVVSDLAKFVLNTFIDKADAARRATDKRE